MLLGASGCMHDAARSLHPDVICLSHLRWNFVFQRPQHLLTRCAKEHRVFYVEEPLFERGITPHLVVEVDGPVTVVVPHLPEGVPDDDCIAAQRLLLDDLIETQGIRDYVLWYYTPMALALTRHLSPVAVVYDCMDELSAFQGAPAALREHERELMQRASLVLTGGRSLYEAKRHQHHNIHALPSSVDVAHFAHARNIAIDPGDQADIPHPRLGFFGVIDERLDIALVDGVAAARPDWHLVMIGPVVKIDPASLPRRPNIHYLGSKSYGELPHYLAGWDVALLPFARNEATRFISPTKTPEYMAAGKPVVSTSIQDVVRPYGEQGLVRIADDVPAFIEACLAAMTEDVQGRVTAADAFLRQTSWDGTWTRIRALLRDALRTGDVHTATSAAVDAAAG
jgi:glycosyltransferase involved in cell wall biosynthesis